MTKKEIEEIRKLYKEYSEIKKMIDELKNKSSELREKENLLKLIPHKNIEKMEMFTSTEALRKLYIDQAKKSENLFNIKVYMGSYYYYNGPDSDDFSYLNDLLTFENDPKAIYRVFCDIESTRDNRDEVGEFIYYSNKDQLEQYEQENTIIVVPNENIKKSIIEASKYSDYERFHGVDRRFGIYGTMDKSIKYNRKGDIDTFGDLQPIQDYFFSLLMSMEPEEAVAKLTKKYKPYRNFYNYDNNK